MRSETRVALWRSAAMALVALMMLAVPALAASDGVTKYRALLIGNSDYAERSGYESSDLASCANDLSAMRQALQSGAVSYSNVVVKSNLKAGDMASAVNAVATWGADDDDVTVFYYTGHGEASGLVGVDLATSVAYRVYSFSLLQSALGNVRGTVVILLDSCESGGLINKSASASDFADNAIAAFSGASSGVAAKAITSGTKFHVIASSSKSEESWAITAGSASYGLTTSALCEAMGWAHSGTAAGGSVLQDLEGDANGDGTVTIAEAYAFARDAVKAMLSPYGKSQNMQVYPVGSAQTLLTRSGSGATPPVTEPAAKTDVKTMSLSRAVLAPRQTLQLNSGFESASWSTSKSSVATVSETGLVTAGTKYTYSTFATIMAQSGGDFTVCYVKVLPKRYVVSKVQLKYTAISLQQNKGYTMPAKVSPSSARYKQLKWTSDNEAVAKVSSTGRILAVAKEGTATITATATSGVVAQCVVTAIPAKPTSVTLNSKKKTVIPGQSFTLQETVLPLIAEDKSVTWTSSRPAIATVENGVVTANSNNLYGKAVITAATSNGKKAYCVVTVAKNQATPRTRPKGASGKLTSSARRIYYSGETLVVEMFFYNRTRYTQKVPAPNPGRVVIRLADKTILTGQYEVSAVRTVRPGKYFLGPFKMRIADYPQLKDLNLLGADAWWEPIT